MADAGWCWDGQGINGDWTLSIFGVGEGTKWFGLRKCCFMFHPNTEMAMEKLRDMDEVVCEISKWEYQKVEHPEYKGLGAPMRQYHDGTIQRKQHEAESNTPMLPVLLMMIFMVRLKMKISHLLNMQRSMTRSSVQIQS